MPGVAERIGRWRTGFGVRPKISGLLPLGAIAIGGASVVLTPSGDLREGVFPWGMSLSVALLAVCTLGVMSAHQPDPSRWIVVGGLWTAAATLGITVFFLAVGIGGVLGIDEETESPIAMIPLLAMSFGILSSTPAMATLAIGIRKGNQLPATGTAAAWTAVPALPALLVFGGFAEGTAESIGSALIMSVFVGAWIVLGLASRRPHEPARLPQSIQNL